MSIEKNEIDYLTDAIKSLDPDAQFSVRNTDLNNINWTSTPIAQSKIDAEVVRLKQEWIAQEYARKRQASYPSVGDQLDMLMKDMRDNTTTHQESCEAVKAKYPKPS